MALTRVDAKYAHKEHDTRHIYIGISAKGSTDVIWLPAYRDKIDGQRVVFARFAEPLPTQYRVWVRDHEGARPVGEPRRA